MMFLWVILWFVSVCVFLFLIFTFYIYSAVYDVLVSYGLCLCVFLFLIFTFYIYSAGYDVLVSYIMVCVCVYVDGCVV